MMKMEEAMKLRHTVRSYEDRKLPESFIDVLNERIELNNQKYRVHFKLVVNDCRVFSPILRILIARGVKNYVVMAGNEDKPVSPRHIVKAMKYEFEKLGWMIDGSQFGKYAGFLYKDQ